MSEQSISPELASEDETREFKEAYEQVARFARIADLRLVKSNFSILPDYYIQRDSESGSELNRVFTWKHELLAYDKETARIGGFFHWEVLIKKGRKRLLTLQATYLIRYTKIPSVGEKAVLAFLEKVGRFATYPYFRNFVSQMSWNADADLPILPVLRDRQDAIARNKSEREARIALAEPQRKRPRRRD